MKLRKKLVAVMAASMVVSSVPVITMADSSNTITSYNNITKGSTLGFSTKDLKNIPTTKTPYTEGVDTLDNYVSTAGGYTTVEGLAVKTSATKLYSTYTNAYTNGSESFASTNLPALEISPKGNYNYGGSAAAKQATAYATLTTDSNFVQDAYLYLMDSMAVDGSVTNMFIDASGRVWNANNTKWNGKTREEVAALLKTVNEDGTGATKSENVPITVYYDGNGDILTGTRRAAAIASGNATGVNITVMDISEREINERKFKNTIKMDFFGSFKNTATYKIPFLAKLGGDKEVLVNIDGHDSFVSSMTYTLTGALTDKRLTVTADSKKITPDNVEEIGEIRLNETAVKSLTKDGKNRWVRLELPSSSDLEFDFDRTKSSLKAVGQEGFWDVNTVTADKTTNNSEITLGSTSATTYDFNLAPGKESRSSRYDGYGTAVRMYKYTNVADSSDVITSSTYYGSTHTENSKTYNYTDQYDEYVGSSSAYDDDSQAILVELPEFKDDTSRGQIVLKGIFVRPTDKEAKTGDVNVTVSEDLTWGNALVNNSHASTNLVAETTVKVAEVKDYLVEVKCDNPPKVKAGRSGIVSKTKTTFTVEEAVKDSLVDSRKIELNLENGYIFGPADVYGTQYLDNSKNSYYNQTSYKQAAKDKFKQLVANETIKFEEKAGKDGDTEGFNLQDVIVDDNGYVTGFTAYYPRLKSDSDDKIKVTMPVAAPVQATGDIKLKVNNLFTRSYDEDVEGVIGNIVEPIKVTLDKASVKVGLEEQTAGAITIAETDKGMLEKGQLYLAAEDLQDGIKFSAVPNVTVSNTDKGVKVDNVRLTRDKKAVIVDITRTSSEASEIKVTDIKFTVDRTVPEANYALDIWGSAITDEDVLDSANYGNSVLDASGYRTGYTDKYIVKDFIAMTTKNPEDLGTKGLKAATVTFKIGEKKFVVNGESVDMDSAAYIKDDYTMVPVKYLAKAFGVADSAMQYDQKTSTATITAANKVVSITAGKPYITVNGTQIPMATKAEVNSDNRMCVPISYIATALELDKSWDKATKTATFSNQTENK